MSVDRLVSADDADMVTVWLLASGDEVSAGEVLTTYVLRHDGVGASVKIGILCAKLGEEFQRES